MPPGVVPKNPSDNLTTLVHVQNHHGEAIFSQTSLGIKKLQRQRKSRMIQDRLISFATEIDGKKIPMVDADTHQEAMEASRDLTAKFGGCAVVASGSSGHFWVFPNASFHSFQEAYEAVKHTPGNHDKYMDFSDHFQQFTCRAEKKNVQQPSPHVVSNSLTDPHANAFVEKLVKHFNR